MLSIFNFYFPFTHSFAFFQSFFPPPSSTKFRSPLHMTFPQHRSFPSQFNPTREARSIHPKIPRSTRLIFRRPEIAQYPSFEKVFNPVVNQRHRFHFRGTTQLPRHSWTIHTRPLLSESRPESLHLFTMRIRSQVQPARNGCTLRYRPLGIFHSRSDDSSFRRNPCTFFLAAEEFLFFLSLSPPRPSHSFFFLFDRTPYHASGSTADLSNSWAETKVLGSLSLRFVYLRSPSHARI